MPKRVFLASKDLLFRAKLVAAVTASRAELTRDDGVCDLAVIELGDAGASDRIRGFVARGVPVVAYGAHVRADLLRAAREAGATAVPNSEVEKRLLELLDV